MSDSPSPTQRLPNTRHPLSIYLVMRKEHRYKPIHAFLNVINVKQTESHLASVTPHAAACVKISQIIVMCRCFNRHLLPREEWSLYLIFLAMLLPFSIYLQNARGFPSLFLLFFLKGKSNFCSNLSLMGDRI